MVAALLVRPSFVDSTKVRRLLLNGGFGIVLLAVSVFSVRHFLKGGWPLRSADPLLVVASALLFLVAYAFKAWGWQRLFAKDERPGAGALACAGGAACVGGVALPGRLEDVLRIADVRRTPGTHAGTVPDHILLGAHGFLVCSRSPTDT